MAGVAFDIGNVLCHFDIFKFTRKLSEIIGISDHDAYFFLDHIQRLQDIGVTTVAQGLEYKFRLNGSEIEELIDTWNKTVVPNETMLRFMEKLRGDEVKIAFLSNMGPEHLTYLRTNFPQMFEDVVQHISCEVGARKPTKLFFQSFCLDQDEFLCKKNDNPFSGCLYMDDIEENLRAGKKYGFKVYQFNLEEFNKESQLQQKRELDKLRQMILNKS